MEQNDFLELHVFTGLKNVNEDFGKNPVHYFSENDFAEILKRVEQFGIGIYTIDARLSADVVETANHESFKKKATDAKWYKKAFSTFMHTQADMTYSATYKVSPKLLAR
mgnify:CR=1 FL=1